MSQDTQALVEIYTRIGEKLKTAREAKGFSLQDISDRSRIHGGFLESVEKGDLENLPALPFVKGFIRNYLEILELKDEEIEGILTTSQTHQSLTPPVSVDMKKEIPLNLKRPPLEIPTAKIIIGALAFLVVIWGGVTMIQFMTGDDPPPPTASLSTEVTPDNQGTTPDEGDEGGDQKTPELDLPEKQTPQETKAKEGKETNETTGALAGRKNLKLTLRGLEPTWVRLSIDRGAPLDVKLEPAETLEWDALEEIRLTVGRSKGVAVYLNGEEVSLSAGKDQLVPNIVLNKLTLLKLEN